MQVNILNAEPATVADTVQMSYDGLSRRVAITESHGGTVLTSKTFVWCGADLCQERDNIGHTVTKQYFGLGEQINGTNYYYTKDHLGSVREMTDSAGVVHASYDYDAFGRQIKLSGNIDSDFGYTGFYKEPAANLDLTWFRAYDANRGRWLNRDPLSDVLKTVSSIPMVNINMNFREGFSTLNDYSYGMNDSFRMIDPLGLCLTDNEANVLNTLIGWNLDSMGIKGFKGGHMGRCKSLGAGEHPERSACYGGRYRSDVL